MQETTVWRPISIGIVAENKKRGTHEVRVTPIEIVTEVQDEITTDHDTIHTRGLDNNGNVYKTSIQRGVTIPAEWKHTDDSNRLTSPDVRRGEQVLIWQCSDTDKYYWTCMGRDNNLRKLETVVWAWSADPTNEDTELNPDNSYYYEISTHDKHVTFSTSRKNGEPAKYTSQYNTGDGIYTFEDDQGNFFYLDSVNHDIMCQNTDESYWRMNKEVIDIFSKSEINMETTDMTVKADTITVNCRTYDITADETYTLSTDACTFTCNSSYTLTTPECTINADTYMLVGNSATVDAVTTFMKPVSFAAGFTATAGAGGGPAGTMEGSMEIKESLDVSTVTVKDITTDNITWKSQVGPIG